MTNSEKTALLDIYHFQRIYEVPYFWKQAAMQKLAAKGLVEQVTHSGQKAAYLITEAGKLAARDIKRERDE